MTKARNSSGTTLLHPSLRIPSIPAPILPPPAPSFWQLPCGRSRAVGGRPNVFLRLARVPPPLQSPKGMRPRQPRICTPRWTIMCLSCTVAFVGPHCLIMPWHLRPQCFVIQLCSAALQPCPRTSDMCRRIPHTHTCDLWLWQWAGKLGMGHRSRVAWRTLDDCGMSKGGASIRLVAWAPPGAPLTRGSASLRRCHPRNGWLHALRPTPFGLIPFHK